MHFAEGEARQRLRHRLELRGRAGPKNRQIRGHERQQYLQGLEGADGRAGEFGQTVQVERRNYRKRNAVQIEYDVHREEEGEKTLSGRVR